MKEQIIFTLKVKMQNIFTKISLEFNLDALSCKLVLHYEARVLLGLGVSQRQCLTPTHMITPDYLVFSN